MIVYTYDLETGEGLDVIKIYNPSVAGNKKGSYVANAADLRIGPNNSVWIYDHLHDKSFPLVRNGRAVQKNEHMNGVSGILFGSRKIMQNENTGGRSLVGENGSVVRDIDLNKPINSIQSQKQGEYLVKNNYKKKEDILTTWDGHDIGRFRLVHRDTWAIYPINIPWGLGADGCIYQVFADYDGIYLYRWSK